MLLDDGRRIDRAVRERARRDAAAARLVARERRLVDEQNAGAGVGEPDRRRRPRRAAADHEDVVTLHRARGYNPRSPGGVPERPKGTGCKPVGSAYGGSNPPAPIVIIIVRVPGGATNVTSQAGSDRSRYFPSVWSGASVRRPSFRSCSSRRRRRAREQLPRSPFPRRCTSPTNGSTRPSRVPSCMVPSGSSTGAQIPVGSTISYVGPILTSPLWLMRNVTVAYHLSQATAAVAFASSAFLVYAIARRLGVRRESSLIAALLSQLVPMGALTATLLAEPYSYPVLLLCVLLGPGRACDARRFAPHRGTARQHRSSLLHRGPSVPHRARARSSWPGARRPRQTRRASSEARLLTTTAVLGLVLLLSPLLEASCRLGPPSRRRSTSSATRSASLSAWFGTNLFVLAVASGWIIVPLAATQLARLARASDARSRVFAHITIILTAGSLVEAAIWGANGNGVYERFTFYASPLLAVAFCVAIDRPDRERRPATVGLAYLAALGALLIPLTNRVTENLGHSPTALGLTNGLIFAGGAPPLFWAPLLAVLAVIAAVSRLRPATRAHRRRRCPSRHDQRGGFPRLRPALAVPGADRAADIPRSAAREPQPAELHDERHANALLESGDQPARHPRRWRVTGRPWCDHRTTPGPAGDRRRPVAQRARAVRRCTEHDGLGSRPRGRRT